MFVRHHHLGLVALAVLSSGCITIDWSAYGVAPGVEDDGGGGEGGTAPPTPVCGNGEVEDGEVCDDGNTVSGDGCTEDCDRVEACGDGELDGSEVCDDGNTEPGDGCRADCLGTEQCGDGLLDSQLELPTAATLEFMATNLGHGEPAPSITFALNGTTIDSPPVRTGGKCEFGGLTGPGFAEFGNIDDVGLQSIDVAAEVVAAMTATGNTITIDTGDSNTVLLGWAMLTLQSPNHEQKIVIADFPPFGEPYDRAPDFCGGFTMDRHQASVDFDIGLGEQCDDGNTTSLDGCRDDCVEEGCGDGVVQDALGETCDDGNRIGFDECPVDCMPFRLRVGAASIVSRRNGSDIVAKLPLDVSDGWPNALTAQFLDDSDQPVGPELAWNVSNAREIFSFVTLSVENRDELTDNPVLIGASKVQITMEDVVSRVGQPVTVAVVDETCGNSIIEGTEDCDDGNTAPLDACSTTCRTSEITLRRVVATRVDNDDLIVVVEGFVSEPGIERLDVRLLDAGGAELAAQPFSFDADPSQSVGAFMKRVTLLDFFANNSIADPTVTVAATLRDTLGQGSNEFAATLLTTTCGDGVKVELFEDCDDGNTDTGDGCDNHCRLESTGSCNTANFLFCSLPARQNRDSGWLWLGIGALLFARRRRQR